MQKSRVFLLVLLCLWAAGCRRPAEGSSAPGGGSEAGAPVRAHSALATARELPLTLAATGTLVPDQQSAVTPIVAGRVMEVFVERGSQVAAGAPLLRLRDVDYRSNAASAAAMLAQARARLGITDGTGPFDPEATAEVRAARANRDLAEDALRRSQQLAGTGALSDQELQRARAQATAAREQYQAALNNVRGAWHGYQQARVAVDQANRAVGDSIVRAPFAGEVAERSANVGEYVTPQRAVVVLVKVNPLRMELQIAQERIAFVRTNQAVELRVDAFPDRVFRGTIRYISAAVRTDTRSLVAEALVPNEGGVLRPGLFATARVDLGQRRQAVLVPQRAVVSEAGSSRVFVLEQGRASERVVSVAERLDNDVVLERGVNAGERVLVDNLDRLSDGARVQDLSQTP
ncbi:MAG: efflux RND transporter periplasmic adaptor subunit [Deltaproteobacteria bacterium]|nr:efflux RND transporter periplasmic adaptor subunit [Deltaproteobacteria bacterium]